MNFTTPNITSHQLNEGEGKVVALAYLSETQVATSFGLNEAVRARFLCVTDNGPEDLGETLVFPQVLRETLKVNKPNAVVGRLTRKDHPKYEDGSYLVLEKLTSQDEAAAVAAFTKLVS